MIKVSKDFLFKRDGLLKKDCYFWIKRDVSVVNLFEENGRNVIIDDFLSLDEKIASEVFSLM